MSDTPNFQHLPFQKIASEDFTRLSEYIGTPDLSGKTILISGATGFFGAWILALFSWLNTTQYAKREPVRILAISRHPNQFKARHPWINEASWIEWISGDIRDFAFPDCAIDYVIHAATDTSAAAGRFPEVLLNSIIAGTERILACGKSRGACRILLVSSGGVYGAQPPDMEFLEESALIAPSTLETSNTYGEGKRVMELLGAIHAKQTGASVVVARCFAFVGAGLPLDAHFAIGNFIRDALTQEQIRIRGDGRGVRSYLYAADLAVWLLRLLLNGASCRAYNVGSDRGVTIAQLAQQVIGNLAKQKEVVIEGQSNSSPVGNRYLPSVARARSEIGLDVWTDLETGIKRTAQFHQSK